jgi:hypothetical protein
VASISGVGEPSVPKCGANRPSDRANVRKSIGAPSGPVAQSARSAGLPWSDSRSAIVAPRRGS